MILGLKTSENSEKGLFGGSAYHARRVGPPKRSQKKKFLGFSLKNGHDGANAYIKYRKKLSMAHPIAGVGLVWEFSVDVLCESPKCLHSTDVDDHFIPVLFLLASRPELVIPLPNADALCWYHKSITGVL